MTARAPATAVAPSADAARVLASAADVRELSARIGFLRGVSSRRLSVRVPGMTAEAERRWERRLGMWLVACGCEMGALFTLSAMAWRAVAAARAWPIGWRDAAASAAWVFGAAVAGKVIGLAGARWMLARDLQRLRREMDALGAVPR